MLQIMSGDLGDLGLIRALSTIRLAILVPNYSSIAVRGSQSSQSTSGSLLLPASSPSNSSELIAYSSCDMLLPSREEKKTRLKWKLCIYSIKAAPLLEFIL